MMKQALTLRYSLPKAPKQTGPQSRETASFLRWLVCGQASRWVNELEPYTRYLANLLAAQLNYFQDEIGTDASLKNLGEQTRQSCDLVIFDEPAQSIFKSLFFAPPGCKAVKYVPTSVLIPRCPRWPLRRILLVTRGQESDDSAVEWAIRLARPSGAAVTVLAVQPAITTAQSDLLQMGGVLDWITTNTPLGQQLRTLEIELDNWLLEGTLRFRRGSLENQIRTEVTEGDYDLIVIAADPPQWWQRRIPGELVKPLLYWADRPVLIAKP